MLTELSFVVLIQYAWIKEYFFYKIINLSILHIKVTYLSIEDNGAGETMVLSASLLIVVIGADVG